MADIVQRAIVDKEALTKSRPSRLFGTYGFTEKFCFLLVCAASKIPEQDLHTPETYHAEEVFDVVLPRQTFSANHQVLSVNGGAIGYKIRFRWAVRA